MNSDPEFDDLLNALRSDLPSEHDSARLRAKLSALGIAAGVTATSATAAASTASAGASAAKGTALVGGAAVQATGWSLAAKLGVAAAVSVSAVSLVAMRGEFARPEVTAPHGVSVASASLVQHARVAAPNDATRGVPLPLAAPAGTTAAPEAVREAPAASVAVTASPPRRVVAGAARGASGPIAVASASKTANGAPGDSNKAEQVDAPPDSSVGSFEATELSPNKTETTLAEETQLIDAALAAVRRSDSALAERWLAEHRRRFPNGLLHRERLRAERKLHDLRSPRGH